MKKYIVIIISIFLISIVNTQVYSNQEDELSISRNSMEYPILESYKNELGFQDIAEIRKELDTAIIVAEVTLRFEGGSKESLSYPIQKLEFLSYRLIFTLKEHLPELFSVGLEIFPDIVSILKYCQKEPLLDLTFRPITTINEGNDAKNCKNAKEIMVSIINKLKILNEDLKLKEAQENIIKKVKTSYENFEEKNK